MKKGIFGLICLIFVFAWNGTVKAEQLEVDGHQVKTARGTVKQIDFVSSLITMSVFDDEITFLVSEDTKITRGVHPMFFVDIELDDPLTIQYIETAPGECKALSIVDNDLGLANTV